MTGDQYGELRAFLETRLGGIDQRFERVDERLERVDQRFERVDQRFDAVDQRFDAVATQVADARRYFGVLAEDLHRQVMLVAEGIAGVSERLDRYGEEVKREFIEVRELIRRLEGQRQRRRR